VDYTAKKSARSPGVESLAPFFFTDTLESVRIVRVATIENPAFYGTMLTSRIPRLIDFRKASGITFIDTILLSDGVIGGSPPLSLLFHEIVHVVQYRLLGVDEFARRYVLGWMKNGYRYGPCRLDSDNQKPVQSSEENRKQANRKQQRKTLNCFHPFFLVIIFGIMKGTFFLYAR
jgi:hypothetical protein